MTSGPKALITFSGLPIFSMVASSRSSVGQNYQWSPCFYPEKILQFSIASCSEGYVPHLQTCELGLRWRTTGPPLGLQNAGRSPCHQDQQSTLGPKSEPWHSRRLVSESKWQCPVKLKICELLPASPRPSHQELWSCRGWWGSSQLHGRRTSRLAYGMFSSLSEQSASWKQFNSISVFCLNFCCSFFRRRITH